MPTLDILGSDAAPSATSLFPINYSPPKCLQKRSCSRCDGEPVREQLPCIPPGAAWPPFFTSLNWRIYKPVQAEIVIWISGEMYRIWARKWRVRQDFGCSQRIKLYGIKKKKIPILKVSAFPSKYESPSTLIESDFVHLCATKPAQQQRWTSRNLSHREESEYLRLWLYPSSHLEGCETALWD